MKPVWKVLVLVLGVGAIAAGPTPSVERPAAFQEPAPGEMLKEVRALRVAIEQLSSAGARAQVLLGRLQMQEGRIASIGRQLQEVRTRVADHNRGLLEMTSQIKAMTDRLDAVPANQRASLEQQIQGMKEEHKLQLARARELEGEEAALNASLTTEQARWMEFNARLDELERVLATPRQ